MFYSLMDFIGLTIERTIKEDNYIMLTSRLLNTYEKKRSHHFSEAVMKTIFDPAICGNFDLYNFIC